MRARLILDSAAQVARDPQGALDLVRAEAGRPARPMATLVRLSPVEALRENGFAVFRGLVPVEECAELAAKFKRAAGIVEGQRFTSTDAIVRIPATRNMLVDPRLLRAVRATLGDEVRFGQVSDLHYLHDTAGWHRDSVHREQNNSAAADWSDIGGRYGIVKAILYLESVNAAMGLIPGSHRSPVAIDRTRVALIERRHGQVVVDLPDEPNRRFSPQERRRPVVWRAAPGDVLVFDQRTYHAGRRVDGGRVSADRQAAKFTLSLVFGLENAHTHRFHSYFRYARRELGYRDLPADLRTQLTDSGLLWTTLDRNYYATHPDELRLAHLRRPEAMDHLVEEFRRAGLRTRR